MDSQQDKSLEIRVEDIQRSLRVRKRKVWIARSLGLFIGGLPLVLEQQTGRYGFSSSLLRGVVCGSLMYTVATVAYQLSPATSDRKQQESALKFHLRMWRKDLEDRYRNEIRDFYQKELTLTKDAVEKLRVQAHIDLLGGSADRSLQKYLRLSEVMNQCRYKPSIEEKAFMMLCNGIFALFPFKKTIRSRLEQAFAHISKGLMNEADDYLKKICKDHDPLRVQANCLYGYFLDHRRRYGEQTEVSRQKSMEQWNHAVDLVLKDEEIKKNFRRLGESLNEVLEIGGNGLLHDTFIFKKNKRPDYLEKEWQITEFAYDLFDRDDTVAQPLAFLKKEEGAFFVLRRVAGKPLAQINEVHVWNGAVDNLVRVHERLQKPDARQKFPVQDAVINYRERMQKYSQRMSRENPEILMQRLLFIPDHLSAQTRELIHRDLHPENDFVRDSGGYTLIDLEHISFGRTEMDLVDLVESRLTPKEIVPHREALIQRYHQQKEGRESVDAFRRQYSYAALFKLLGILGTLERGSYGFQQDELATIKSHYRERVLANAQTLSSLDERVKEPLKLLEDHVRSLG